MIYTFVVEIEPDEDRWFARLPDLESQGAATWGYTRREALRNIHEVGQMVIESLLDRGKPVPRNAHDSDQPVISITV